MTSIFDYAIPDHIPENLVIFALDGDTHPELKKNPFKVYRELTQRGTTNIFQPGRLSGSRRLVHF